MVSKGECDNPNAVQRASEQTPLNPRGNPRRAVEKQRKRPVTHRRKEREVHYTPTNSNVPSYQGTGALTMFSHKVRRSIRASTLLRENTGAVGPFGYRERRQTNSSALIRNCIASSTSGRSKLVGVVSAVVPVPNAYFVIHLFCIIKAPE